MWVTVAILKVLLLFLLIDENFANIETNFHRCDQENFEGNDGSEECGKTFAKEKCKQDINIYKEALVKKEIWALKS